MTDKHDSLHKLEQRIKAVERQAEQHRMRLEALEKEQIDAEEENRD